jgi:chorismate mutase
MGTNLNISTIKNLWPPTGEPLIIAGPCSAESEEQLSETAQILALNPKVKIFRAGIWKPRTRPDGFEGIGSIGLRWLKKIKESTGLLTTVEVANPLHIEECLKNDIDILWIGARTVGNPFSMQEIAEALKGIDIPVMIKNPLNPDLKLWIGAFERLNNVGINKLMAIHRGFSAYNSKPYRNAPYWEIPIELKRIVPGLPIICDPSHIAGDSNLIAQVSQRALDLEMNGLMIEVHPNPKAALTDAKQQLTPDAFKYLLDNLIFRSEKGNNTFQNKLANLRAKIDIVDDELIQILAKRMNLVSEIGNFKKEHNITILQLKRWNEIINNRLEKAEQMGLDRSFILHLLEIMHQESIQIQNDILNMDNS